MPKLRPGEILHLEIEKNVPGGFGLGRHEGQVIFVRNSLPGSTVSARVYKSKKNFAEARLVEIIKPSGNQIAPTCQHFFTCGGCSFQHMPYPDQLIMKESFVREAVEGIGKLDVEIKNIIPSPDIWHYRNKVEFSFGINDEEQPTLGYKLPGRFNKVFTANTCKIFDERADEILAMSKIWLANNPNFPVYIDEKRGGTIQYLVLRRSIDTNEMMLNLVLRTNMPGDQLKKIYQSYFEEVINKLETKPEHVVATLNSTGVTPQKGSEIITLFGKGVLQEKLAGLYFTISPFSFFQTNTRAAELLCAQVEEYAEIKDGDKVLDLYCGTGTIGQTLASKAREVVGIELNAAAVDDANQNALSNGIENYQAIAGDVHKMIFKNPELVKGADLAILDPPRSGLDAKALQDIRDISAQRVVYVSCNPATLARDLGILSEDYLEEAIQPVDLFPHTPHTEAVAKLTHR